jgi:Domain of unknown function (DUF5615)
MAREPSAAGRRRARKLDHDVLTSHDAGNANRSVPDEEVLVFAASQKRILLTLNRKHFIRIHNQGSFTHCGIVVCTFDPDFIGQARRIHQIAVEAGDVSGLLLRINRPAFSRPSQLGEEH